MMRRMNLGFLLCRPFCFLAAYTIFRDEHTHTLYKIENRNSIARPAAVERPGRTFSRADSRARKAVSGEYAYARLPFR